MQFKKDSGIIIQKKKKLKGDIKKGRVDYKMQITVSNMVILTNMAKQSKWM